MKFFTHTWIQNGSPNSGEVYERYESYLSSVRAQLPKPLATFELEHSLDEAKLDSIHTDFKESSIVFNLTGWELDKSRQIQYTLKFIEVSNFLQDFSLNKQMDAKNQNKSNSILHWESEVLGVGVEVRILLNSFAKYILRFNDFAFAHEPIKDSKVFK